VQKFRATAGGTLHVPPAVAVIGGLKNLYLCQNFVFFLQMMRLGWNAGYEKSVTTE